MSAHLTVLQGGADPAPPEPAPGAPARRSVPTGIRRRHARGCPASTSDDMNVCACPKGWPHYQAQAGPRVDRRTKTFATLRDAERWRARMRLELDRSGGRVPKLRDAGERWLAAVATGKALSRSGTPYRATTIAGYRRELRERVYPALGSKRLDEVTRGDVLALSGSMQAAGLAPTTVRNAIVPLRALYRWAGDHDITARNPIVALRCRAYPDPGVSASLRRRRCARCSRRWTRATGPSGRQPRSLACAAAN